MTALTWDQVGDRIFETGIDRGVLYLEDGTGVVWNGLLSVTERVVGGNETPLYYDGVKFGDHSSVGEFSASLKAFTYPDEFLEFEGILDVGNGLFVTNQRTRRFGLSYRTKIGSDEDGIDSGYKIHLLYNLTAVPSQKTYQTISNVAPIEFEWNITGIPVEIPTYRPTCHLIFDSRKISELLLSDIEATLYGDESKNASLPPISSLVSFVNDWVIIRIIDNGDGTWTAVAPEEYITILDDTTFQINNANAVMLDSDTYLISDLTY